MIKYNTIYYNQVLLCRWEGGAVCDQCRLRLQGALLQQAGLLSRRTVGTEIRRDGGHRHICFICRLPFDEEQLEIADQDKTDPFEKQPQGYINNNPAKNSPVVNGKSKSGGGPGGGAGGARGGSKGGTGGSAGGRNRGGKRQQQSSGGRRQGGTSGKQRQRPNNTRSGSRCPGGNVESCLAACEEIGDVKSYTTCVKTCGSRC